MECIKCNTACQTCPCTCGCENIQPTSCIQYTGSSSECIGYSSGEMLETVLKKISEKYCDVKGFDGLSAYEIAVSYGFQGTESEWWSDRDWETRN